MKHYNSFEWQTFGTIELDTITRDIMQEHLLQCTDCMQSFLDSVNDKEIEQADLMIPDEFAMKTLQYIEVRSNNCGFFSSEPVLNPNPKLNITSSQSKSKTRRLFSYYAAAAAITLMLMSGGVFQSAASQVARLPVNSNSIQANDQKDFFLSSWSAQLRERTTRWIGNIEKEVR